jgi:hypothetical protein
LGFRTVTETESEQKLQNQLQNRHRKIGLSAGAGDGIEPTTYSLGSCGRPEAVSGVLCAYAPSRRDWCGDDDMTKPGRLASRRATRLKRDVPESVPTAQPGRRTPRWQTGPSEPDSLPDDVEFELICAAEQPDGSGWSIRSPCLARLLRFSVMRQEAVAHAELHLAGGFAVAAPRPYSRASSGLSRPL